MTRLVVVGQGYVGLPMALRAAEVGIDVVGRDSSATVVTGLRSEADPPDVVHASDLVALLQADTSLDLDALARSGAPVLDTRRAQPTADRVHRRQESDTARLMKRRHS